MTLDYRSLEGGDVSTLAAYRDSSQPCPRQTQRVDRARIAGALDQRQVAWREMCRCDEGNRLLCPSGYDDLIGRSLQASLLIEGRQPCSKLRQPLGHLEVGGIGNDLVERHPKRIRRQARRKPVNGRRCERNDILRVVDDRAQCGLWSPHLPQVGSTRRRRALRGDPRSTPLPAENESLRIEEVIGVHNRAPADVQGAGENSLGGKSRIGQDV